MKKNTKSIILGLFLVAALGFSVRGLNMIGSDSNTSQPEVIPVYNIAERPNHPFYAIGEQVILTVTVLPEDASDKTVVWTSSDPTKVSITKLTDFTARMRCEAEFTGSITITATATNGTADPSDDYSVTCIVTYVVPVTSIELVWAGSPSINIATHAFDVGDQIFFNVVVLPSNATDKTYTVVYDEDYLGQTGAYGDLSFEIIAMTPVGVPTNIAVYSNYNDEIHDEVDINIGQEFDSIAFFNNSKIYKSTNGGTTWGQIGQNLGDYIDAYYEYQNVRFNTGDFFWLDFGGLPFKSNRIRIGYDSTYCIHRTAMTLTKYSGDIQFTDYNGDYIDYPANQDNYGAIFEVLQPISFSSNFGVKVYFQDYLASNYPNEPLEVYIPFIFSRPVSGITIDTGTYVF